ncbi:MutS-related protein [Natrarchaeobius oligotrophus]|uniref:DNA mismatch repair protein n=1 Tax=Natrarchaeobius chitinivorans TaxID=1679083 RepID=A0A3N6MIM8_NATCH|nr:DNA mismatch repair protein [Natrarchaeobius chitinivorans]RQH03088.1 DNA mismatch repair protein [Natrarchaeobius chitinivorans]
MRLEEYWGVGPKTREALVEELGRERAIRAIESGDVRTLSDAGLPRGRATRILRRATGDGGMETLATSDARAAYKELLDLAVEHAVTRRAADRIRVLTPLTEREAMEDRLDDVLAARDAWSDLSEPDRTTVLEAYDRYDERDESEHAAVETAIALLDAGVDTGPFAAIADLERDRLERAATALAALDDGRGRVREGADDELDRLRDALGAVEDMDANALELIEELRSDGVRDVGQFREAFEDRLLSETAVTVDQVRDAMPTDAADATDFVGGTLRGLRSDLTAAVDEREETVARDLEETLEESSDTVDRAVEAVDAAALHLSLARFALSYDCTRPTFVEGDSAVVSVVGARNLTLVARESESVQAITYALGDHELAADGSSEVEADDGGLEVEIPGDERVAVLTGANSGGKTTLLETLCQVVLLASMGLPVPAERAAVTPVDSLVFHRRHASFNAGVLESTLRSIVPPLSSGGRTLMLVDEFEAITEPGSAADLLHGLVTLSVDRDALGVFVTHLADDLEPLPPEARVDGIFAEGLNPDLELLVDYQPRFDTVGRSTPEFIVSRLVANATDRSERVGFETLAEAVGNDVVQRTLADARWSE